MRSRKSKCEVGEGEVGDEPRKYTLIITPPPSYTTCYRLKTSGFHPDFSSKFEPVGQSIHQ